MGLHGFGKRIGKSGERGRGREREPTAGEQAGEGEVRIWPESRLVIRLALARVRLRQALPPQ
jgi:hypothetical protein